MSVETASAMFDDVVVIVLGNPSKPSGWINIRTRVDLIERSTVALRNVRCTSYLVPSPVSGLLRAAS